MILFYENNGTGKGIKSYSAVAHCYPTEILQALYIQIIMQSVREKRRFCYVGSDNTLSVKSQPASFIVNYQLNFIHVIPTFCRYL